MYLNKRKSIIKHKIKIIDLIIFTLYSKQTKKLKNLYKYGIYSVLIFMSNNENNLRYTIKIKPVPILFE